MSTIVLGFLLWGSVVDVKYKSVSVHYLVCFFLVALTACITANRFYLGAMIGGISVGGLVLFFSYLTEGGIGSGDGFIIAAMGVYLGFIKTLIWCGVGFFLSGIAALLLWMIYRDIKQKIPLIPFLWCSGVWMMILGVF